MKENNLYRLKIKLILSASVFALAGCSSAPRQNADIAQGTSNRASFKGQIQIVGDYPHGTSLDEMQIVVYKNDTTKKITPYNLFYNTEIEEFLPKPENFDVPDLHPQRTKSEIYGPEFYTFQIGLDTNFHANEIIWFQNGKAYQTLQLEYVYTKDEFVGIKAFMNEKELCVSRHKSHDPWFIHVPGTHPKIAAEFPVYKTDSRCHE